MLGDSPMVAIGLASAGFALTWLTGRGGFLGDKGSFSVSWSPKAILLAVVSIGAAVAFYEVSGGIAIIVAIMWHEWGHVIAFRVAGHRDARFRLIPLLGGVAISDKRPKDHATSCFITLMGPGFSVSLVVILVLAEAALRDAGSPLARDFGWAAKLTGAINAFNMLPLWPLDGGRALRSITVTAAPKLAGMLTTIMSAALAGFAIFNQMWFLLMFAVMGYQYAQRAATTDLHLRPMPQRQAILASVGYLAIFGANLLVGWPIFRHFLRF